MGGTCYEVIMAYAFNAPTLWNFDFSLQMYGAIFMMAAAYTLCSEAHVRGDVIYRLFKPKQQGYNRFRFYILYSFFQVFCFGILWFRLCSFAWKIKETSWNSPAQIKFIWQKLLYHSQEYL